MMFWTVFGSTVKKEQKNLLLVDKERLVSRDLLSAIQDFRQDEDINVLRDLKEGDAHTLRSLFIDNIAFLLGIVLLIFALVYSD